MDETQEVTRDERGRWINAPKSPAPITHENAHEFARLREEKRMRLYNEGALRAVQDTNLLKEFGEDAHLVERAMTLQTIATTPDAGKAAVLADTALQRAQGYDIGKQAQAAEAGPQSDALNVIGAALVEYIRRVDAIPAQIHETIDGDTVE